MSASTDPLLRPYYVREIPGTHEGRFVAEGRHNVEALIRADFALESVFFTADAHPDLRDAIPAGVPVIVRTRDEARVIFGVDFHLGVAAVARAPEKRRIADASPALFDTDAAPKIVVVCPCLGDASNLGAIVRNAAAFGADAVVCGDKGVSPWSRKAVRAASGTMWALPVFVSPDLHADLETLANRSDVTLAATRLADDAASLADWKPSGRHVVVLMGGEAQGLAPEWLKYRHDAVVIPMARGVDSLNVAATSAVVLWHLRMMAGHR